MVVSFGHANFRLTEDLVSLALEAAIGGYCGSLKVSYIKERVFFPLWYPVREWGFIYWIYAPLAVLNSSVFSIYGGSEAQIGKESL
jgi:hypothetical protein